MGNFTVIPQNTFEEMQLDAGVLLKTFNPASPSAPQDSDIICATTGGITISCTPTYSDMGSDVDNCPLNMKELKHLDSWEVKVSFTSLGTSVDSIKLALGAADITSASGLVKPRRDLSQSDFANIWWVGDRADGGLVAAKIINALSTGGFSLKTTKSGKGNVTVELSGHVSLNAQNVVPIEFYSLSPTAATSYRVVQNLYNITSNFTDNYVDSGSSLSVTLTADNGHTITNAMVLMGGVDVTASKYSAGAVTISSVTGDVIITASANET